jgi:Na+-driven multidrug efflux pump
VGQAVRDVGGRDLDKRIARLAVPALGAILAEPLYNLADTAIVGHLGRSPLDALAIAMSALSIVAWLAILLSTATTTEVSRNAARGDHGAAGRAVGAAYSVAVGWGAVACTVVVLIAPPLVSLLGGHAAVGSAAAQYIRISSLGLPFLYLSYAGNGHLWGAAGCWLGARTVLLWRRWAEAGTADARPAPLRRGEGRSGDQLSLPAAPSST